MDTETKSPAGAEFASDANVLRQSDVNSTHADQAWHAGPVKPVFDRLHATPSGLSSEEAAARLRLVGPNALPVKQPPGFLVVLLHQFTSPLIYVLAAAGAVSFAIGDHTDAAFIMGVLALNAAIGSWQEWKAERGMLALQQLLRIHAVVVRDGEASSVDAEEIVPGDVVVLESGNRVPADLRLSSATGVAVDESLLTGESIAATKDPAWEGPEGTSLGDRLNMLHAGSTVIHGRARGVVVATAERTVVGQIARGASAADEGKPPLVLRMERFTRVVAVVVLAAAVLIGGIGVLLRGLAAHEAFLVVVALAVSAIPEGLPVGMTVALSVATNRMSKRAVIVRRLAAVEGLGSCTLIATDKTGTLTVNELTARQAWLPTGQQLEITGEGFSPAGQIVADGSKVAAGEIAGSTELFRAATLCNEAEIHRHGQDWTWHGDPTDAALLFLAHKAGWERSSALERHVPVNQIPFEPERRYAASYHRDGETVRAYVKGAPEKVLSMCGGDATEAKAQAEAMAAAGYRVLAFAQGEAPGVDASSVPSEPTGLSFLGLVGMIDPLRSGVIDAVQACASAGVTVSMVTGDHPVTALAIARSLGMADDPDEVVTGSELEGMPPDELVERVKTARVFARMAPQQKLEIVRAAQQAGHFVAVTGDGVNDAPALRHANIGVAMGKHGTDVAREAAELVLTDDNFASIVGGIEEGRIAYDNVRKVIYLLVSTGAAELVLAGLAVMSGLPLPLLPVQLLWLNLVTNGIQDVALAFEPGERDVMKRTPRPPKQRIFDRLMIERTVVGATVIALVGFGVFAWLLRAGWSEHAARNALLLLMVLFENVHVGNCRSEIRSVLSLSPLRSPILLGGTLTAFAVHVLAMHWGPLQALLRTEPVSLRVWVMLAASSLTVLVALELHKWLHRRRELRPLSGAAA